MDYYQPQISRKMRRRNPVSELSGYQKPILRRNYIHPSQLVALRRNPTKYCPRCGKLKRAYNRNPWSRRNPDPSGKPWGPTLYNPLIDKNHPFKDESHYQKMISKLKRNPYQRESIANQFYF